MTDTPLGEEVAEKKSSKLPLLIGLVLALLGGGGGFFVMSSGLLGGGPSDAAGHANNADSPAAVAALPDVGFVEVPPFVISLHAGPQARHLRFRTSLEVPREYMEEVTAIMPRVQDVLNSYLRALGPSDIEAQGALIRLRAQMLRRVQLVTGRGRVNDLLVLEFVLT